MMMETDLKYYSDEKMQAVELPYGDGNFSMLILLPDISSDINDFIADISAQTWNNCLNNTSKSKVILSMPKFTFKNEYTLNDVLMDMGMETAFSGSADFSGMFENTDALISKVKHKTFIDVNEEGTEAAAVTSVGIDVTSYPGNHTNDPIIFNVNRPFVFVIRESNSDCILFLGKVINPSLN
jgi:serpin B